MQYVWNVCGKEICQNKLQNHLYRIITKIALNASKEDMSVFKISVVQGSNKILANCELAFLEVIMNIG